MIWSKCKAFMRGALEFRSGITWADPKRGDDDELTALDHAYDWGREMAHRITLRRFDA